MHGYDPFTLAHPSALLSVELEREVLRTLVGAIGVLLRVYETTEEADIYALQSGFVSISAVEKATKRMQVNL